MNEITKIHLGRTPFTISVEANKALTSYLHAIARQVGEREHDVIKEIELRMAELLNERSISGDKVILPEDVTFLKDQLGEPKDFKDDDERPAPAEADEKQPKRLFRDTEHAMVAGVAAGLAAYLGIDAVIIRLLFVLATFTGGWGIPLYIILWLVVPEAKTSSDRLQMRGKAVTVDAIKEAVARADVPAAAQRAKRSVPVRVVQKVARVFLGIMGVTLAVTAGVTLFSVLAAGVYGLGHHGQVSGQNLFPVTSADNWLLLCAMAAVSALCTLLILAGASLVSLKWKTPGWLTAALIGLFIVTSGIGAALTVDAVPRVRDRFESLHHTSSMAVAPFTKLDLNGSKSRFYFQPDSRYSVDVRYLGNPGQQIAADVHDGTLSLDTSALQAQHLCTFMCYYNDHDIEVTVHAPSLESVAIHGKDDNLITRTSLNQGSLTLTTDRDTFAHLAYINARAVTITDNSGASVRTVTLTGLQKGALESDILDVNDFEIALSRANDFTLLTDVRCDDSHDLVHLLNPPLTLKINDQLMSPAMLNADQGSDTSTVGACVMVR